MTDTAELIGRLKHAGNGHGAQPNGYYGICTEAATALETLQSENERLRESESNLVKQINGYKDALAQAEGIIYELREEKQIDHSPRTRWG